MKTTLIVYLILAICGSRLSSKTRNNAEVRERLVAEFTAIEEYHLSNNCSEPHMPKSARATPIDS